MSIFSDLKPKANASRNAFDRSCRQVFSNKVGNVRAALALDTLPSSEYEIDMAQLMRTQPLQTAAFTGAQINYDFVFVPYNYLYSSFNQFISQREQKSSSSAPSNEYIPNFAISYFCNILVAMSGFDYLTSQYTQDVFLKTRNAVQKGLDASQYTDDFMPISDMQQLIYANYHTPNQSSLLSAVANMDMLGYGNVLPLVKMYYNALLDGLATEVSESTEMTDVKSHITNLSEYPEALVNFFLVVSYNQHLDNYSTWLDFINAYINGNSTINTSFQKIYGVYYTDFVRAQQTKASLFRVLAYNKCWYEYYRNTYYDENFKFIRSKISNLSLDYVTFPYVKLFNLDDDPNLVDPHNDYQEFERILAIFCEKPHQYKRDMFTGVLPSTQFGDVSVMSTTDDWSSLFYKDTDISSNNIKIGRSSSSQISTISTIQPSGLSVSTSNASNKYNSAKFRFDPALAISVLESRRADAFQRFKERMLRAGNDTKDIFEAHGWSRPKSQSAYAPTFLGSYDGNLDINVVAATTGNSDQELGQLGANGVCVVRGNKVHFNCSDFGVVLCLNYITKAAEYDSYGLDVNTTQLEPFDFPYPELQNISLVPLSMSALNTISPVRGSTPAGSILGYLPRSFAYKTNVDKVHGEFFTAPLVANEEVSTEATELAPAFGVFRDWVTPRPSAVYEFASRVAYHYIQNDAMDNVFAQAATSRQDTDQFLFNVQFDVKAVQPLPVIGLPI